MDELGITGVIGASVLKPTLAGSCVVGPALTVRNIVQREHVYETARRHVNKMAEFEAHNLARPGDVVVIDGVPGISNMGGVSAQTGKRQGEAGAIVFGGVRDVAHSRRVGYPVWATEVTPVTGKWRIESIEINGEIQVAGIRIAPGDIVFADDTGVCFIPRAVVADGRWLPGEGVCSNARRDRCHPRRRAPRTHHGEKGLLRIAREADAVHECADCRKTVLSRRPTINHEEICQSVFRGDALSRSITRKAPCVL